MITGYPLVCMPNPIHVCTFCVDIIVGWPKCLYKAYTKRIALRTKKREREREKQKQVGKHAYDDILCFADGIHMKHTHMCTVTSRKISLCEYRVQ